MMPDRVCMSLVSSCDVLPLQHLCYGYWLDSFNCNKGRSEGISFGRHKSTLQGPLGQFWWCYVVPWDLVYDVS
uniref:Uncharacterized protein n=1 Tax=Arundo donax TaxID=35708 RepID=A0A0A8Z5N9_ARUDO